jgi:hypothetical protein
LRGVFGEAETEFEVVTPYFFSTRELNSLGGLMRRQYSLRIVDLKHSTQGTTILVERAEPIPPQNLRLSLIDGTLEEVPTTSDLKFDELEPVFQTVMRVMATLDGPEEFEQKVLVGFRKRAHPKTEVLPNSNAEETAGGAE